MSFFSKINSPNTFWFEGKKKFRNVDSEQWPGTNKMSSINRTNEQQVIDVPTVMEHVAIIRKFDFDRASGSPFDDVRRANGIAAAMN
jgi:hypothetical protein